MDPEEVRGFIINHLTIRFDSRGDGNCRGNTLTVRLMWDGEEISSDYQTIREGE